MHYFFCGIGGSGMSALAMILSSRGETVSGSDRSFDQGANIEFSQTLTERGITLCPQDGSGITREVDVLVVSTAIEQSIPDVKAAVDAKIKIIRRAELLEQIFSQGPGIAVGGTSGKTTVTAMAGHILREVGKNPTVVNGGIMINSKPEDGLGNAWCGDEKLCVIEADESDGTIEFYSPQVAVLTTVSLDHQPMDELHRLFKGFIARATEGAVINADCADAYEHISDNPNVLSFGIDNLEANLLGHAIQPRPDGVSFEVNSKMLVHLQVPGRHNVLNALAAIAACALLDVAPEQSAAALASFKGTRRRLEVIGKSAGGITVIDDFGHNPEKIAASLDTLNEFEGRMIVFYQPHGFKPTRMLKDGLIESFITGMRPGDVLVMPEIFYAGGTVTRDISSKDLTDEVEAAGFQAIYTDDRDQAFTQIMGLAQAGDRIIVMGARDNTLTDFARAILAACS
ncbi:hypothetical protein BVY04_01790 [bacterium M21]|nr:hypothetical protein BVY04_01790 [bacterium M21]